MTVDEIKAIMLEDIKEELGDWYDAFESNDKELALRCRDTYLAKVDLYEKVFEGEIVYHNEREVYVETVG